MGHKKYVHKVYMTFNAIDSWLVGVYSGVFRIFNYGSQKAEQINYVLIVYRESQLLFI